MIGGISGISGVGGITPVPGGGGGAASPLGDLGLGGELTQQPNADKGQNFGQILGDMVMHRPSESQSKADTLAASFAAGDNVDPHTLAIATAKAGVEIQMATRTISQAVQAVRTLFQMQI